MVTNTQSKAKRTSTFIERKLTTALDILANIEDVTRFDFHLDTCELGIVLIYKITIEFQKVPTLILEMPIIDVANMSSAELAKFLLIKCGWSKADA